MKKQILIGVLFLFLIGIFVSCRENTELISYYTDKYDDDIALYYCKSKNDVIALLKKNDAIDKDFSWKEDVIEMKDPVTISDGVDVGGGILFLKGWSEFDIEILSNMDDEVVNEYEFRDGYYLGIDDVGVCDSFYYLKFKKGIPVKVGNKYLNIDDSWYIAYGL